MALTRAYVESVMVDRCGPLMGKANLPVTIDGTNAKLNDAIRQGLALMGIAVVDPALVTDADVSGLDVGRLDEFLDRTELRVLKTIQRNLKSTTIQVSGLMVYNSDLLRHVNEVIRLAELAIKESWGLPGGGLSVGVIQLGFQATDCYDEDF